MSHLGYGDRDGSWHRGGGGRGRRGAPRGGPRSERGGRRPYANSEQNHHGGREEVYDSSAPSEKYARGPPSQYSTSCTSPTTPVPSVYSRASNSTSSTFSSYVDPAAPAQSVKHRVHSKQVQQQQDLLTTDLARLTVAEENLPKFDDAAVEMEKSRLYQVWRALGEFGPQTPDDLFSVMWDNSQRGKPLLFESAAALEDFVDSRSFLFHYVKQLNGKIYNRPLSYAQSLLSIVAVLFNSGSEYAGVLFEQLKQYIIGPDRMHLGWQNQKPELKTSDFVDVLLRHEEIFRIDSKEHDKVSLYESAVLQIPSLLRPGLLPSVPDVRDSAAKGQPMWDITERHVFRGTVTSVNQTFAKVHIDQGVFKGKTVYTLLKNVSLQHIAPMNELFPQGTVVIVVAHRTYGSAHEFSATKVIDSEQFKGKRRLRYFRGTYGDLCRLVPNLRLEDEDEKELEIREIPQQTTVNAEKLTSFVAPKETNVAATTKTTSKFSFIKAGAEPQNKEESCRSSKATDDADVKRFIAFEKLRSTKIDVVLNNCGGTTTTRKVYETLKSTLLFDSEESVLHFARNNPHLYILNDNSLQIRSEEERSVLLDTLRIVYKRGVYGMPRDELFQALVDGACGAELKEALRRQDGPESFDAMMQHLEPALFQYANFEQGATQPARRFVAIRGCFVDNTYVNLKLFTM